MIKYIVKKRGFVQYNVILLTFFHGAGDFFEQILLTLKKKMVVSWISLHGVFCAENQEPPRPWNSMGTSNRS